MVTVVFGIARSEPTPTMYSCSVLRVLSAINNFTADHFALTSFDTIMTRSCFCMPDIVMGMPPCMLDGPGNGCAFSSFFLQPTKVSTRQLTRTTANRFFTTSSPPCLLYPFGLCHLLHVRRSCRHYALACKWRRGRDSNPGWSYPHNCLAGSCLQPLGHLSLENNFMHEVGDTYFDHGGERGIRTPGAFAQRFSRPPP
jgi:hypothetical protein